MCLPVFKDVLVRAILQQGGVHLPRVRVPHGHLRHGCLGAKDGQFDPGEAILYGYTIAN
jgi:hypothetical protein